MGQIIPMSNFIYPMVQIVFVVLLSNRTCPTTRSIRLGIKKKILKTKLRFAVRI